MTAHLLLNRLRETQTRIASAALRYGRNPHSVGLIAISKGQPAASLRTLAQAGQRDFGENYLQEALPKQAELADLSLTWHFTGQIQGNKTRAIAEHFHWVHTLDRDRIATRLNEQRPLDVPPLNVCVQVRLADEAGKGGVPPEAVPALAKHVNGLPRLKLRGLMCLPPHVENFREQLEPFQRLAACLGELNAQNTDMRPDMGIDLGIDRPIAFDTLSMGMSADMEAAICAGATWVRIGTALFGERSTPVQTA